MSNLSLQDIRAHAPTDLGHFRSVSRVTNVTLYWVDKRRVGSTVCGSAECVSEGWLGVLSPVPVPLRTTVWIVFLNGSGFWGVAKSCQRVESGHLAELHLIAR